MGAVLRGVRFILDFLVIFFIFYLFFIFKDIPPIVNLFTSREVTFAAICHSFRYISITMFVVVSLDRVLRHVDLNTTLDRGKIGSLGGIGIWKM